MISMKRILRDYREAGALSALVSLWGFVDENVFITKAGAVGVVYRLHAQDAECLDHDQRAGWTSAPRCPPAGVGRSKARRRRGGAHQPIIGSPGNNDAAG